MTFYVFLSGWPRFLEHWYVVQTKYNIRDNFCLSCTPVAHVCSNHEGVFSCWDLGAISVYELELLLYNVHVAQQIHAIWTIPDAEFSAIRFYTVHCTVGFLNLIVAVTLPVWKYLLVPRLLNKDKDFHVERNWRSSALTHSFSQSINQSINISMNQSAQRLSVDVVNTIGLTMESDIKLTVQQTQVSELSVRCLRWAFLPLRQQRDVRGAAAPTGSLYLWHTGSTVPAAADCRSQLLLVKDAQFWACMRDSVQCVQRTIGIGVVSLVSSSLDRDNRVLSLLSSTRATVGSLPRANGSSVGNSVYRFYRLLFSLHQ